MNQSNENPIAYIGVINNKVNQIYSILKKINK